MREYNFMDSPHKRWKATTTGVNADNKSLCDTCLYKYSCERSDAGISWVNHSVCYGYAPVKDEKDGTKK